MTEATWRQLNRKIVSCDHCPRLIKYCQSIAKEKRKSFLADTYWGKPVPNFGDPKAQLLIVGLAPAAHGANRTGRMFTGDRSGEWLYRALFKAGFANQAQSIDLKDQLKLHNCVITATAHCAPPQNKPTPQELEHCQPYLDTLIETLPWQTILCLGQIAWKSTWKNLVNRNWAVGPLPKFKHGSSIKLPDGRALFASYHPSQQNTFTGVLTQVMFDSVFSEINRTLKKTER